MPSTLTGASATAIHIHQAFFGAAPTAARLATYTTQAGTDASGFASGMAAAFVNLGSKALALQVLTNLNITPSTVSAGGSGPAGSYAVLLLALEQMFDAYGLSARGQIILNATNLLANLESDATYGVAAQHYNTQATAFYAQSTGTASSGGGGGATPTPTISGKLVDGYVSGATVFADANGNGVWDSGEATTTTDTKGNFSLSGGSGPLIGMGGTDLSTGLAFRGILKAPAGSTMINPLTSLQQSFVAKGLSVADAQTKVATAMGFSGSVDLTTFDPLAAALGGGADAATGATLQAAAVKLANFMVAASKTLEGVGAGTSETAGNALLESMADAINADGDGVISLTDTTLLQSVMNGAATLNNPTDGALLAKVASIADNFATMSAAAAKNVDDALAGGGDLNAKMVNIAQSAVVAQGDMADQLATAAAASDPDAAMNALDDNYTDAAFANVANSATIGDLNPNSTTDDAATSASNAATPPALVGATVDGDVLVLTYSDALDATNAPATTDFAVSGNTVTAVVVDPTAKTVTLTLGTAVAHGAVVTVGYTDPTAGNDAAAVQDAAGNDAATITAQPVTNNTPDTTAPVFASAATSTDGTTITLTYNEALAATTAAGTDFAVTTGGVTNAVTGVSVSGSTVVLTLTTPVTNGQAVTVAYTAPAVVAATTNAAVQDTAGNDAATLASTSVTNNVPDTTAPTASAFTATPTTVGATSNEAGTLKLFNNADGALIGTATLVANVANTITVAAQSSVVTATLKVFDTAGNEAATTKTVMLGTVGFDSTMFGTAAAEFIYGFDAADYIVGGGGGDTMTGGAGNDTMSGGVGDDTFNVDAGTDTIIDLTSGDILVVSAGAAAVAALAASFDASAATSNAGAVTLTLANAIIRVDMRLATGSTGYVITAAGNTSASTILGSAFADTITGGLGNDGMNGGLGNDTFNVEAGNDTVSVLQSGDILVVSAGATASCINVAAFVATAATVNAGTATLKAPTSVGATISVALATGANGFGLVGSTGVDTLTGSAQADTIKGGANADVMAGGLGADTFQFASRSEVRGSSFSPSSTTAANIDRITDFVGGIAGDVIQLGLGAAAFGTGITFTAGTTASVTAITVASATNFTTLASAAEAATTGVASTSTVARLYDVTVSTGSLAGRYLMVNDSTPALAASDTIISLTGITGGALKSDANFSFG